MDEAQCRICLGGIEDVEELGRLIKPCLCTGTMSHVHIKCLDRWRTASTSNSAFYTCQQCHYNYRFARTRAVGLATNPAFIAVLSSAMFTALVLLSSFFTTFFMDYFQQSSSSSSSYYFGYGYFTSPIDVIRDLVHAALRIMQEEAGIDPTLLATRSFAPAANRGPLWSFVQRFIIGLPLLGAASLIQLMGGVLAPVQWLARTRAGNRGRRRDGSRDAAALIVVGLLIAGSFRALYHIFKLTEKLVKLVLSKTETAIVEVT